MKTPPPTQELIDDWLPFWEIVAAYIREEIEKSFVFVSDSVEDEILNSVGDEKPTGFINHDHPR